MSAKLLLIRHASVVVDPLLPSREWQLSDAGRQRANALAASLLPHAPAVLVSSTEPKARDTAQILHARLGVPVETDADLCEHHRGSEPFVDPDVFRSRIRMLLSNPQMQVFGDETGAQTLERFSRGVQAARARHPGKRVAIVSHGVVIALYVASIQGGDPVAIWEGLRLPDLLELDLADQA